MKLSEVKGSQRVLIIGGPKTGKTHVLGTLCDAIPTVLLTGDPDGLDTLKKERKDPLEVVVLDDWEHCWDAYEAVQKAQKAGALALAVDDLGAVQRHARFYLNDLPRGQREAAMRPDQRDSAILRSVFLGDRKLELRDYGKLAVSSEAFIYALFGLGFRTTWISVLEEERDHPRSGEPYLYPALAGAIREDFGAFFSLVANTFVAYGPDGTAYYSLTTRPHPHISTGDRYGEPRTWVNPTAARLLRHITGKEEQGDKESALEKQIGVGSVLKPSNARD